MQTLQLDGGTARRIYPSAPPELKEILEKSFTKEFFLQKVEDRIWSVEDACTETGRKMEEVIPFQMPINQFQDCMKATAEWAVIVEAFNESRIPNWRNSKEEKHVPYAKMNGSSGSGLSFGDAGYVFSNARVASRLHFLDPNHLKIAIERFPTIWERMMTQSAK